MAPLFIVSKNGRSCESKRYNESGDDATDRANKGEEHNDSSLNADTIPGTSTGALEKAKLYEKTKG